jgi:BSD domain
VLLLIFLLYVFNSSDFQLYTFLFVADFDMSEAQIEHAMAIERLAPRLAALRIELCPIHMSEDTFWKIYFVLLHPRLSKHDADLLSTPQVFLFILNAFIVSFFYLSH